MAVRQDELQAPNSIEAMKKLINDFYSLLSKHIELFTFEVKNETKLTVKILTSIVISAIAAYTGFIFVGLFVVLILGMFMPLVLASLIVTALYILSSVLLLFMAKRYFEKIKQGNESVRTQILKTMESIKKWLLDLK